jgi:hypothetical protein
MSYLWNGPRPIRILARYESKNCLMSPPHIAAHPLVLRRLPVLFPSSRIRCVSGKRGLLRAYDKGDNPAGCCQGGNETKGEIAMKLTCAFICCLACLVAASTSLQAGPLTFMDDFNRPDGVLGPPWVALESPLHIQSHTAVADSGEFGLMMFTDPDGCHCDDASLEILFSFNGDTHTNGRFQIYLIGHAAGGYSGFIGKLALDFFAIFGIPEVEIATKSLALSPAASYRLRLAYDHATTTATLTLTEADGTPVDEIAVTESSGPLTAVAIGVENLNQPYHAKWLDDARFDYCCEATSAREMISLESWGQVKGDYRE